MKNLEREGKYYEKINFIISDKNVVLPVIRFMSSENNQGSLIKKLTFL